MTMRRRLGTGADQLGRHATMLLVLFLVLWLVVCLVVMRTIQQADRTVTDTAGQGLAHVTVAIAESVNRLLFEYMVEARTIALAPVLQQHGSEALADYLRSVRLTLPEYVDLLRLDVGGRVTGATDARLVGQELSQRPWFHAFARAGQVASGSGIFYDEDAGVPTFMMPAVILREDGEVTGFVALRARLQSFEYLLDPLLRTIRDPRGARGVSEYQVVGAEGEVVYDSARRGAGMRSQPPIMSERVGTMPLRYREELHPERRVPVLTAMAPLHGYGSPASWRGTLIVRAEHTSLLIAFHRSLTPLLSLAVVTIGTLLIMLAWCIARLRNGMVAAGTASAPTVSTAPEQTKALPQTGLAAASAPAAPAAPQGLPDSRASERRVGRDGSSTRAGVPPAGLVAALEPEHWDGLKRWVRVAEVNRVALFKKHEGEDGTLWASRRYEWIGLGEVAKTEWSQWFSWSFRAKGFPRWEEMLGTHHVIAASVSSLPPLEATALRSCGIQTVLVVPLFAESGWWGFMEFDHCLSERTWTQAEIQGLSAAAQQLEAVLRHTSQEEAIERVLTVIDSVLEATGDGILVVDGQGQLLSFNHRLVNMWRLPDAVTASQELGEITNWMMRQLTVPEVLLRTVGELTDQPDAESYDVLDLQDGRMIERFSKPRGEPDHYDGRIWAFRELPVAPKTSGTLVQDREAERL